MNKRIRKKKHWQKIYKYILENLDKGISVQCITMLGYTGVRFDRLIKKIFKTKGNK